MSAILSFCADITIGLSCLQDSRGCLPTARSFEAALRAAVRLQSPSCACLDVNCALQNPAAASSFELLNAHRQRRETHPDRRKLTGVMLAGRQDLPSLQRAVGACNHSVDADTFDAVWVIVPDRHLVRTGTVFR